MPLTLILRTVGSWVWRAVRRSPETGSAGRTPSLTIGALTVNTNTPETPAEQDPRRTPRTQMVDALLLLAEDLLVARFALVRALEHLDLLGLQEVYEEIFETVEERVRAHPPRIITPRNQIR